MYRITVKSRGKYHNVVLGARYCFLKHSVIDLATSFAWFECDFVIEKLIRIHHDIFSWSESEVDAKIWNKVYETLEKIQKEED